MAALVDKYRPDIWEDLIGQNHVINFFKSILKNPEKYPSNIIINGPFGTGKTTSVRIFSNELKKIRNTYYYEWDSTIVGNKNYLTELRSRIDSQFNFSQDYRILVFDEFHHANSKAQSVFMKTLEDNIKSDNSDRNIYFFFLTTDSSKIIDTIKSRCIEINFYFISKENIRQRLIQIIEKENIKIDEIFMSKIVELSEGHLRDAIVYLDIFNIVGNDFSSIVLETKKMIYDFIFGDLDNINEFFIFPVNILIRDLNKVIESFVQNYIEKEYMLTVKFLEIYFKYKNYVKTIEDFISVVRILKKYFKITFKDKK